MLEELFCAHRAELTAYCRGLCRSDAAAQDMVQEVFLRAWQNIGTLQDLGPSQRRAWLYRTARNLFVDAMRRTGQNAAGHSTAPGFPPAGLHPIPVRRDPPAVPPHRSEQKMSVPVRDTLVVCFLRAWMRKENPPAAPAAFLLCPCPYGSVPHDP